MNCPNCGADISTHVAQTLGSRGGSVKGASKRRDVDYAALAQKAAKARARNRARKTGRISD